MIDFCHSPSVKNGLTFLKSVEAYTSKSTSLLLSQDKFLCTFTNIQKRHPHFTHPQKRHSHVFFLKFYSDSLFFLDIHVVRDNDAWVLLGNSGGEEVTPTRCLFHLVGLLDQIGTETRRGEVGADRSLCRNEPERLKESCP